MRRALLSATLAVAAVLTAGPASAAPELPPVLESCDVAQNCVCGIAASALAKATGRDWLHCA